MPAVWAAPAPTDQRLLKFPLAMMDGFRVRIALDGHRSVRADDHQLVLTVDAVHFAPHIVPALFKPVAHVARPNDTSKGKSRARAAARTDVQRADSTVTPRDTAPTGSD